jgi:hypothetical protein
LQEFLYDTKLSRLKLAPEPANEIFLLCASDVHNRVIMHKITIMMHAEGTGLVVSRWNDPVFFLLLTQCATSPQRTPHTAVELYAIGRIDHANKRTAFDVFASRDICTNHDQSSLQSNVYYRIIGSLKLTEVYLCSWFTFAVACLPDTASQLSGIALLVALPTRQHQPP